MSENSARWNLKTDAPCPFPKICVSSDHLLRMHEFAVGRNDPDLVVIDTDSHGMMCSRVDEVYPYPFLTRLGLHNLQFWVGLSTVLDVRILVAWDHVVTASLVTTWSSGILNVSCRFASRSSLPVERQAVSTYGYIPSVTESDQIHVHRLVIPVSDDNVPRVFLCFSHGLDVTLLLGYQVIWSRAPFCRGDPQRTPLPLRPSSA